MPIKLALIGGGGVRTYYFVQSLIKFAPWLGITRLSVMDTDPVKPEIFGGISRHLIKCRPSRILCREKTFSQIC